MRFQEKQVCKHFVFFEFLLGFLGLCVFQVSMVFLVLEILEVLGGS